MGIGLGYELPIALGSEVLEPAMRLNDAWQVIVPTGLKQ
jgi:hypothetical protein